MTFPLPEAASSFQKYICIVCGWIYDEELGDPDSGLPPGTRFDDIPDDWSCPLCGVAKADFEPYTPASRPAVPAASVTQGTRSSSMVWDTVIVGAGSAGWSMAERLRTLAPTANIAIVSACEGDIYPKPLLSVALSRDLTDEHIRSKKGEAAARELGISLFAQTYVSGIDPTAKRLRTTQGTLRYKSLVLAYGARPALSPGLPSSLVWRINNLRAWQQLRQRIGQDKKRITVVGAGLVGCELAEDAAHAGHEVTLLYRDDFPLQTLLPEAAARITAEHLRQTGITLLANATVRGVQRQDSGIGLDIAAPVGPGGIQADIVIAAIGLETDLRLPRAAGLNTDCGIVVNPSTLQTSGPDIYAMGDCISVEGVPCRYIAPLAAQTDTIAHEILGLPHSGYRHQPPKIRLKSKVAAFELSGRPCSDLPWETVENAQGRLVMQQRRGSTITARLEV